MLISPTTRTSDPLNSPLAFQPSSNIPIARTAVCSAPITVSVVAHADHAHYAFRRPHLHGSLAFLTTTSCPLRVPPSASLHRSLASLTMMMMFIERSAARCAAPSADILDIDEAVNNDTPPVTPLKNAMPEATNGDKAARTPSHQSPTENGNDGRN